MSKLQDIEDIQSVKHINIRTLLSNINISDLINFVKDISKFQFSNRHDFHKLTRDATIKYGIKPKKSL